MLNMKTSTLAIVATAAVLLTGCIVTSVYPFYSEKDLIFDPSLLGQWTKSSGGEQWTFEKEGTAAYHLTIISGGDTNKMQAHLFKLQDTMFLDLFAPDQEVDKTPPPIPSHYVLRVLQVSPELRMANMSHDWLRELVEKQPKIIAHEMVRNGTKPEDARVVLTARTPQLQKFLLRSLKTQEAWGDELTLSRE